MDYHLLDNRTWCMNHHLLRMEQERLAALLPPKPVTKWTKYQKFGRKVVSETVGIAAFGLIFGAAVLTLHGFDEHRVYRSGRFIASAFRGGNEMIQTMVKGAAGKVHDKKMENAVPIMEAQVGNLKPQPKMDSPPKMEPTPESKHREG
jgi:hypothetical protein